MSDKIDHVEKMVQERNLNAPRITPDSITKKVKDTEYIKHVSKSGKVLRWCLMTMENGFTAVGAPSVSVSIENDIREVGEQVAFDNTFDTLWPLEGYLLHEKLYKENQEEHY